MPAPHACRPAAGGGVPKRNVFAAFKDALTRAGQGDARAILVAADSSGDGKLDVSEVSAMLAKVGVLCTIS